MGSDTATLPALTPPPGTTSNFVNPDSIQPAIVAALSVCLVASTLSGIVRLFAQLSLFKRLSWADFWIALGWTFQIAFAALILACLPYGGGRHQWDVTKENYNQIEFFLFVDFILYDVAILGSKVAILLQLKDIFASRVRNRFYWMAIFLIAVNIGFYIALSFALIFQCQPVSKGWDPTIEGVCLDQDSLLESSGPFNIISDFLIFLLPISAICHLHIPNRTRLAVASAFAVGLFGCVCSAVRLYYSHRLQSTGDVTYLLFQNQLWANAEVATGLLIANTIIVPRFIRHKRGIGSSREHTYSSNLTYGGTSPISQQAETFSPRGLNFYTHPYVQLASPVSSFRKAPSDNAIRIPLKEEPRQFDERDGHRPAIVRTVQIERRVSIQSPQRVAVSNARLEESRPSESAGVVTNLTKTDFGAICWS